ncbi:hypothetical protein [Psychrobacter sp. Rd 27.2]|uniref:hypothetical protein n=1 Tax=Psychrobacter sp. Rd 27.2 TaxID=1926479 RepID=UPI000946BACB|nr:hypothetical protein [Psychrobacter sp. Rd 27.2]OLF40170.1 hypothetical protein BTV99_09635 [Psychrobacter sp. Rd 27.2]
MNQNNSISENSLLEAIEELKGRMEHIENVVNAEVSFTSQNRISNLEYIRMNLRDGKWNLSPERKVSHGWDQIVDTWIESIPTIGDKIPSAYRIWQSSNRYLKAGMLDRADRCERLNYLFHNSYVPAALELEGEVIFAYGGIGVILHKDAEIAPGVTIGANVTIGGNGSKTRMDKRINKLTTVPKIGALTVIGAGANITGGIEIGPLSIIAPNTIVTKSVPAGTIIAGAPGKEIGKVTINNALRYKSKFLPARSWSEEKYLHFVKEHLLA